MDLQEAMTRYRTLVLEARDGLDRHGLLAELAHGGFRVRRTADPLHHLDPARSFRDLLAGPGRLAVDGGMLRELVYGPLRRGRSRVTWIQALDFAEAVAERDGALVHLMQAPRPALAPSASSPRPGPYAAPTGADDVHRAYDRAFRTLGQHVPVVILHDTGSMPGAAAPR